MGNKSSPGQRLLPVLLFGLSFSLLAYEVVLLRVLSYLQWYHFAYLVISLALLGFGASGTLMHVFRSFWQRHFDRAFSFALLFTGAAMAGLKPLLALIPTDTFLAVWQPWQLGGLALLCLMLFLPFFGGAFGLILVFSAAPGRIALNYGANLLGSGAGALGGLLLLHHWHPVGIPACLGLATGGLGLVYAGSTLFQMRAHIRWKDTALYAVAGLGVLAVTALLTWAPLDPAMSPYKALSRTRLMPDTEVLLERASPLGVLTILRGPTLRSATGLSLSYQGEIKPQAEAYLDGNPMGSLPLLDDTSASAPLRHASFSLPYRVRSFGAGQTGPRRVLVLEAGTGAEVQQALMVGSSSVTAVVRHPELPQALDYLTGRESGLGSIYRDPRVELVLTEPRGFLYRSEGEFDVIMVPPTGGVVSASAAMQAIYENNLLTREGAAAMLERLSPDGLVCISTWLDSPPRRPLKLFNLLAAALRESRPTEVADAGAHLAAIGSWNVATMVLSRRPWTSEELGRIRRFAATEGFDLLYLPDQDKVERTGFYHQLADTTLVPSLAALAVGASSPGAVLSPFFLKPPTDNRPFFHHFLTLRSLPIMRHTLGTAGVMLAEWGYVLLWITLVLLLVGGAVVILLPLWFSGRASKTGRAEEQSLRRPPSLLYFGVIGCGFMFVEIVLIQKLVLVLGDPVYATAAVITALLVFAGVGSMLSGRLTPSVGMLIPCAVAAIILLLVILFVGVSLLAPGWAALDKGGRLVLVVAALAPLALAMGIFFPTGVRWLDAARAEHLIPWAWGVNGFASVITTPLATIAALNLGFSAVVMLGAGCYLLAAAVVFRWWARRQANQPTPVASPIANSHHG
ncbi:MAG: hypothetical protein ACETWG_05535 [Candidatus Neomarinimicrobiota bacterium]